MAENVDVLIEKVINDSYNVSGYETAFDGRVFIIETVDLVAFKSELHKAFEDNPYTDTKDVTMNSVGGVYIISLL